VRFVQGDAALGKRQRLVVAVLEREDRGLIPNHRGDHVVSLDARGEPFRLAERGHRLAVPAKLRERNTRQRMHQREMAPIACRVERRRGPGEMLADDGGVTDLAVAHREFVVGEADGPRVVCRLTVLQRAPVKCDRA